MIAASIAASYSGHATPKTLSEIVIFNLCALDDEVEETETSQPARILARAYCNLQATTMENKEGGGEAQQQPIKIVSNSNLLGQLRYKYMYI